MIKYEYRYAQNIKEKKLQEETCLWGADGWRVVHAETRKMNGGLTTDLWGILFERPVPA